MVGHLGLIQKNFVFVFYFKLAREERSERSEYPRNVTQ